MASLAGKLLPIVIVYWDYGLKFFILDVIETPFETAKILYDKFMITIATYDFVEFDKWRQCTSQFCTLQPYNSVYAYCKVSNPKLMIGQFFVHIIHNAFKKVISSIKFPL